MSALYVHVPFCHHICSYCDFCKVFYQEDWVERYLDALAFEIKDKKITGDYQTIYIGGGTPSSLSLRQLKKLLDLLQPFSQHSLEYSIEVNPESMNEEKLNLLKEYQVNRLSIGVQTFHNKLLKEIGRHHTSKEAIHFIELAQSMGFDDMNVDLIYGLPQQTLEDVYEDIEIINQLGIGHISIYSLILEDYTILKHHGYIPLNDEEDAYWYEHIHSYLKEKGFIHYEVSNYYKKKPSLHNLVYWHYQDYQGIGLSAHSLIHHHRLENTRNLTKYLNNCYLDNDYHLELNDEIFEKIMMGLRLREGLDIDEINDLYHIDLLEKYKDVINKYVQLHMLEIKDRYLRVTFKGMNYLNTILVDFLD
ncbi:MAG: radical SAM family heme chaperone HemW [Coprobacillus sp.]|nr:radical SAM family heme chaperone HemW [Coprobacillus sp.]